MRLAILFIFLMISSFSNAIEMARDKAMVVMGVQGVVHSVRFRQYDSENKFEILSTKKKPRVVEPGLYYTKRLKTYFDNVAVTEFVQPKNNSDGIVLKPGYVTYLGVWDFPEKDKMNNFKVNYSFNHYASPWYLRKVAKKYPEIKNYPIRVVRNGKFYDAAWGGQDFVYLLIPPEYVEVEVTEFGIYQKSGSDKDLKYTLEVGDKSIPAKRGINFGFKFQASEVGYKGNDIARKTALTVKIHHPNITDPRLNFPTIESAYPLDIYLDQENYYGYELTYDWEAVPGAWVFEIWGGEKLLAREEFNVRAI